MIRVELAPEPPDFDEKIRQRGLDAIAELIGEAPSKKRRGPKRKKVFASREEIPPDAFPTFWTEALNDLLEAYHHICAYACIYIESITGSATVDHAIPKSKKWDRVYEWENYRLACSTMNSRKDVFSDVLDPIEVENGWFVIELVGFQVLPSEQVEDELRQKIEDTITRLRLNDWKCTRLRECYALEYWNGHISFEYLKRRAPFVAMELERQKQLEIRPS